MPQSFLLGQFHPVHHATFSLMLIRPLHRAPVVAYLKSLEWQHTNEQFFLLYFHLHFMWISLSTFSFFISLVRFHQSSQVSIFVKCIMVLSLRHKRQHNCKLCCLDVSWATDAHTLKEMAWGSLNIRSIWYLYYNYCRKVRYQWSLCLMQLSQYMVISKIWTVFSGELCELIKTWHLSSLDHL